jgi:hypothetical protein
MTFQDSMLVSSSRVLDGLTREEGADMLSRSVGQQLSTYAEWQHKKRKHGSCCTSAITEIRKCFQCPQTLYESKVSQRIWGGPHGYVSDYIDKQIK